MTGTNKAIVAVTVLLLTCYAVLVAADCTRLGQPDGGLEKPLITISESIEEEYETYWGLGYSVRYEIGVGESPLDEETALRERHVCGAELRLFGGLYCRGWIS